MRGIQSSSLRKAGEDSIGFKQGLRLISFLIVALLAPASARAATLGEVTGVVRDGRNITVQCGVPAVRFEVWDDSVVRVRLSADGSFAVTNTADDFMIRPGLKHFKAPRTLRVKDADDSLVLRTDDLQVAIGKRP